MVARLEKMEDEVDPCSCRVDIKWLVHAPRVVDETGSESVPFGTAIIVSPSVLEWLITSNYKTDYPVKDSPSI